MTREPPAPDLERRKQVRLRLRPDIRFTAQPYEGSTFYVLKDPASLRYYRFDERDYFLLQFMDGRHTLAEAQQAFEVRFRPRRLSLEDLEGFAQLLVKSGLAYHDLPQAGRQLYERRCRRRRLEWLQAFTNILYIEIPLVDPDPLLGWLLTRLRWLLTGWALYAGVGLMLAALALVASHWSLFWTKLPAYQEFFSFKNLIYLWLALGLVKILHELGHGLTCKAFGGEVHDMGALLLCLSPCLYLNVTDAWTLRNKWKRMLTGLAGIYVELLVAALATFVWWNTESQPLVHHLCLSIMVVYSVNTVMFNGNPLLRYDGYYVLADWLEVPNLREQCNSFLKRIVMVHCLGMEVPPEPAMGLRRRIFFVLYAITSYIYGWVVTFGVLWFMSRFLAPYKLGTISMLLAGLAVASMMGWPMYRLGKGLYQRGGKLPAMQSRRVLGSAGAIAAVVLFVFLVPLPVSRVRQTALVAPRPDAAEKVFVTLSGMLESLHVRDGQPVEAGDILAEFRSLEREGQLEEARSQHAVRLVQLQTLRQQAGDTSDPPERARIEIAVAQADGERRIYAQQIAVLEKSLQQLVLRSPRAGVVLSAPRPEEIGKLWDKDLTVPFCTIGDPRRLRAIVPVSPADYRLLKEDLSEEPELLATIRVQGWGQQTWQGTVAMLPESEAREVPLALTTRAGGPLAVKPAGRPNVYVPQNQHYLVAVDFRDGGSDGIWLGTLAQVKIHCRWRTTAWWLWRTIAAAFDLGLV